MNIPDDLSLDETVDLARKRWAESQINQGESYRAFAQRIGVSYRTVLRWLGRLSSTKGIVRRVLNTKAAMVLSVDTLPLPTVWTPADLALYRGPLVYVALKDGVPMYVGSSKNGALRLLAGKGAHSQIDVVLNASMIYLYRCPTRGAALALESEMIDRYQPPFNVSRVLKTGE